MHDEQLIRDLQAKWFRATADGDHWTLGDLMTEDVVFLTPNRPPFGRQEFFDGFIAAKMQVAMECQGDYEEIIVAGDIAYTRAKISVTISPKNGSSPKRMEGYTLSVYRRSNLGQWQLCRDANMIAPVAKGG